MQKFFPKNAASHAGKFMLAILALFLLFNFILSFFPLWWFEYFFAQSSLLMLNIFGIEGTIEISEPVLLHIQGFALPIAISYLCTGILELTVIWSAILSSFGIDIKKRIIGAFAATIFLGIFNIARISASILIIAYFGLSAGEFSHDILFRVFLFVTIALYYYLWFNWASGKENIRRAK